LLSVFSKNLSNLVGAEINFSSLDCGLCVSLLCFNSNKPCHPFAILCSNICTATSLFSFESFLRFSIFAFIDISLKGFFICFLKAKYSLYFESKI